MSMLDTLTEGIKQRMLSHEGEALLQKWERTGLLEGLDEVGRNNMARLLENQAGQLLKESTTMQVLTSKALPLLHSQSFAVFSVDCWHRTSFRSNR